MNSLLLRIFVSFWLIIGITIGTASLVGYWYSERLRASYEEFDLGDTMLGASAALESAGREGLTVWLRNYRGAAGLRVLVLDGNGRDLLDRPIPRPLRRMLERRRRFSPATPRERRDPDNVRRARPLSQLIGPDGVRYTFVLVPTRDNLFFKDGVPVLGVLLFFALIVSAAISLLLARALSRPVSQLREATMALAAGSFDSRVAATVGKRGDELGLLARDFDLMAGNLQRSAAQQTELSRNISHELRSPLARLRVALELARQKVGEMSEFDRIDSEAERLDNLIAQILKFTRLDSIAETDKRTSDLNELVADVVADVNFECESEGVQGVSVQFDQSARIDAHVHADSIRSAVENILRNAVRHTRANSRIKVSICKPLPGDVRIAIEDSGPGVAPDELDRLFEPFFRTAKSTADDGGTGLGLAIARRAVELHGGSITAQNRPAGGLRICLDLPVGGQRSRGGDTPAG